jgi:hypothetical protein
MEKSSSAGQHRGRARARVVFAPAQGFAPGRRDRPRATWFRKLKASAHPDIGHGIRYQDTPWHKFEIQHYRFRKYMKRLLKRFGACATLPLDDAAASKAQDANAQDAEAPAKLKLAS